MSAGSLPDVVYLREVDGTGSWHPCAKGDPGALAFVPECELPYSASSARGSQFVSVDRGQVEWLARQRWETLAKGSYVAGEAVSMAQLALAAAPADAHEETEHEIYQRGYDKGFEDGRDEPPQLSQWEKAADAGAGVPVAWPPIKETILGQTRNAETFSVEVVFETEDQAHEFTKVLWERKAQVPEELPKIPCLQCATPLACRDYGKCYDTTPKRGA